MANDALRSLLSDTERTLAEPVVEQILKFYDLVLQENERQNLTRLTAPQAFYEGHVVDAFELLRSKALSYPALDLGSGMGSPGLLAALIGGPSGGEWILCESERRKAEFLEAAISSLGVAGHVRAVHQRAEAFLAKAKVGSVVCKAVGPVDRIYGWLRPCSTWNNLVLLKGPGWEKESEFLRTGKGKELRVRSSHPYSVGTEGRSGVVVCLERVPRGTKPDKNRRE